MKIDKSVKNVLNIFAFEAVLNLSMVNNAYAKSSSANADMSGETITLIMIPAATAIITTVAFGLNYLKKEKENKKMIKCLKKELKYIHEESENIKLIF